MKKLLLAVLLVQGTALIAETKEELIGLTFNENGIVFQVASKGCTRKSDFEVELGEIDPAELTLLRMNEDTCELDVPYGVTLTYTYAELGLAEGQNYSVTNRLVGKRKVSNR